MASQEESDEEYLDDPIQLIDFKQTKSFAGKTKTATDYEVADADGDLFVEKYNKIFKNNLPRYENVAITLPVSFFEIPENLNYINQCRPLSIKIVDCDKHPWYYKKYLRHANVAKDAIKSNNVKENIAKDTNLTTIEEMKPKIRPVSTPYEVLVASPKANQMPGMKVESNLKDLQTLLKEQSSKLKNVMQVDFKKNQGLIGMKISLTQETYTALRKKHEKDKKVKTKTKDKKHVEETSSVVKNKIILGNVQPVTTNNVKTSEMLKTIAKSATNKVTEDILLSHVKTDRRIDTCAHAKSLPSFTNKHMQDSQKNNACEKKNTPQKNKQPQNNNNTTDLNIVLVKQQKQKNFHSNSIKVLPDDWEIRKYHSRKRNNRKANEPSTTNVDFQDIKKIVNREEKVNKIKQSAKKSSEVENKINNQTSCKENQGNIKNKLCKPQKSVTKKGDEVDRLIKNLEFSSKDKTQGIEDDGKAKSIEKQNIKRTKNINKISNKKPEAINSVNGEKVTILNDQVVNSGLAKDVTSCNYKAMENAIAFVELNTSAVIMQKSNIPNASTVYNPASASQKQLSAFHEKNAVNIGLPTQPQLSKLNISHSETVRPVQICGPGNVDKQCPINNNYARDSIHKDQVKLDANENVTILSVSNSQTIHQNILPSCNVSQMPSNGYTGKPIRDNDFTYSPEGQLQTVVNANKNLNTIPINSYVVPYQFEIPLPGRSKLLAIRRKNPDLGIAGIHDKLLEHFPDYASHVEQNNDIALQRLVQDLQNSSKPENTNSADAVKNGATLDSVKIINSEANLAPLASISHNVPQKYQMKKYPGQHLQNVSKPSEVHHIHAHVQRISHSKMQTTAAGNKVDISSNLQNPTPHSKSIEERPRKIQILISNRLSTHSVKPAIPRKNVQPAPVINGSRAQHSNLISNYSAAIHNLWLNSPIHQQLPPTCDIAPPQLIPSLGIPQNTQLSQFPNTTTLEPRQLLPKLNMPSQNNLINNLPVKTTKRQMLSNTNPIILKKTRLCNSNNKIAQHFLPQQTNALTQQISDPNYEQFTRQMCGSGIPSSPHMLFAPISSDNPINMNPADRMPYEMQNYLHYYYPYTPQMLSLRPPPPPPPYFGPHYGRNQPPQNVNTSVETNQTTQSPKSVAGSTIIGCNNTGPVRKINILATPTDISEKNSHNPTKIQPDNEKPVASKKEMMEELSKIDPNTTPPPSTVEKIPNNDVQIIERTCIPTSIKEILERPLLTNKVSEPDKPNIPPVKKDILESKLSGEVKSPKPCPLSKKPEHKSVSTPLNIPAHIDSSTHKGPMTGYSPPILPIPSYIKTLEIFAKSGILETTKKQIEIDQRKNREKEFENNSTSKSPKRKLQEDMQDKGAKKISLDEYKKRATKTDDKKDKTMRANAKIEMKCDNPEQDLGYDSDSTIKI